MISRKELFAEISNEAVTEDGEVVGYFVKNSRMNLLEQMLCSTVTVKLPDALLPATHKSGELFMTPDNVEQGGYLNRDDVLRVLRAAGIKVEGE